MPLTRLKRLLTSSRPKQSESHSALKASKVPDSAGGAMSQFVDL